MRPWPLGLTVGLVLLPLAVRAAPPAGQDEQATPPERRAPPAAPETEDTEHDEPPPSEPDGGPPAETAPSADAPEAEDMQAIREALAADREQLEQQREGGTGSGDGSPQAAPAGQSPSGVTGALQTFNPELTIILDTALAVFSDDDNLQSGAHDPNRNGFNLQQVELAVGASVDPYFRLDGNIVFFLFGVEVEELYATTLGLPAQLQLRVGQFFTRFGRQNRQHVHVWDFVDQPFAFSRYFGGEGLRGLGVELSWLTPLPWYVEIVGAVQNANGAVTRRSFFGDQNPGIDDPRDLLYSTRIHQFWPLSADWSLSWGLSAAFGPNATGPGNRTEIYGSDLYLKYRPISRQSNTVVSFQAEVLHRQRQVPGAALHDTSGLMQLLWRFALRWETSVRYEWGTPPRNENGWVVADDLDPEWIEARHRISSALTYRPSEWSRIRVQGSVDLPRWREGPIYAGFLATEFIIGSHGAHEF